MADQTNFEPTAKHKFIVFLVFMFFVGGGILGMAYLVWGLAFGAAKTPDCAAEASLETLKQAAAQQLMGALPEKLHGAVDLTASMIVDGIKTKSHDEKLDRYVCEAKFTYRVSADKAAKISKAVDVITNAVRQPGFDAGLGKTVLNQYGPATYGALITVSQFPDIVKQPVEVNVTYQIQKLEGKNEKGQFEVKVVGLTDNEAVTISTMETLAALKYDGPAIEAKPNAEASVAGPADATTASNQSTDSIKVAAIVTSGASNQSIDSWLKSCAPFSTPVEMEGQIRSGQVSWNGAKVHAVDSADSGANSVIAVTLNQPYADFKVQHPEFGEVVKFAKNQTCPLGIERSLSDQSFSGAKGATVECKCLTGAE